MLLVADDTEEAPWMVMGDAQFWAASSLAHSLRSYAAARRPDWYVAGMLPINYRWKGSSRLHTVAPDVFVAVVENRPRQSYNVEAEGSFPPFVLEVVSPSSVERDLEDKLLIYRVLGAREYALLRTDEEQVALQGYRQGAGGEWESWAPDQHGRLWSEVLELFLLLHEGQLQAMTREGQLLPTPQQMAAAWQEADDARRQADDARRQAEAEAARLRAELARLHGHETG